MRRLILLFCAALLVAWAFSQPATAVVGHFASGTGTSSQNNGSSFNFTATGGPGATGGGATGSMTYQQTQGNHTIQAEVRCLWVSGNRATVVGLIVASTVPPPAVGSVGNHMIFYVEDNGTPGAGVDEWSAFFGGADEANCTQFIDLANPIQTGEILVSETGPPPTCPPGDEDADDDGLTDDRESLFGALSNDSDSNDDGVSDGNEDSDDDGEDDEDEDDADEECPDDSDGDGTDDEDEDD